MKAEEFNELYKKFEADIQSGLIWDITRKDTIFDKFGKCANPSHITWRLTNIPLTVDNYGDVARMLQNRYISEYQKQTVIESEPVPIDNSVITNFENVPDHYKGDGSITCSQAMFSMTKPLEGKLSVKKLWWWCCAFKYLWRWPLKNGVEDLDKCIDCINRLKKLK